MNAVSLSYISAILSRVKKADPSAYVAGGALRDLFNNRPVKDVDVFVSAETDIKNVERRFTTDFVRFHQTMSSDYFDFADPTVKWTQEYRPHLSSFPVPVNIIALAPSHAPLMENIHRFDFGFCRIAYDGETITHTPEYSHDINNKVLTLRRCENEAQMDRSMARYARFFLKYPWPLVVPEEFKKFNGEPRIAA